MNTEVHTWTRNKDTQCFTFCISVSWYSYCVFWLSGWFVFHFTNILQCVIYNLTTVSPVYSEDPPVQHRDASLPSLLDYYSETDSVLSGVRGLISELKSEQNNLHLWRHNNSTCREQWHTLHSLRSDQFSCESISKEKEQINVWWIIGLRFKMSKNKNMIINHLKPHSKRK